MSQRALLYKRETLCVRDDVATYPVRWLCFGVASLVLWTDQLRHKECRYST
jgi:hypothetical protein